MYSVLPLLPTCCGTLGKSVTFSEAQSLFHRDSNAGYFWLKEIMYAKLPLICHCKVQIALVLINTVILKILNFKIIYENHDRTFLGYQV